MEAFAKQGIETAIAQQAYAFVSPTVAHPTVLTAAQQIVRVTFPVGAVPDVVLPKMEDAAGRLYYICQADLTDLAGSCNVTGQGGYTTVLGAGGVTSLLLYCTGFEWATNNIPSLAPAELAYLDTVLPGVAQANKAVVLGAAGEIDALDVTALSLGGVAVAATAAEIDLLAGSGLLAAELDTIIGVTPGTKDVSKALVTDAAGQLDEVDLTTDLLLNGSSVFTDVDRVAFYGNAKHVLTFEETAGAGMYTAVMNVPAGYSAVLEFCNQVLWDNAGNATMNCGDDDDPDGFFVTVDVKADPVVAAWYNSLMNPAGADYGVYCGALKAYPVAKTITCTIQTDGAGGGAGRSTLIVTLVKTASLSVAAKV